MLLIPNDAFPMKKKFKALNRILISINEPSIVLRDLGLTELPRLPTDLKLLYVTCNKLTVLPELPELLLLDCSRNKLTALPELPSSLIALMINKNCVRNCPEISHLINLESLSCAQNKLTCLPELPNTSHCLGVQCVFTYMTHKQKSRPQHVEDMLNAVRKKIKISKSIDLLIVMF